MRRALLPAVVLALVATPLVSPAPSAASSTPKPPPSTQSLPRVTSGSLPGPAVLYSEPPTRVPQLENRSLRFLVPHVRVAGTEVYGGFGEYVYTDHLYDDFGSDTGGTGGAALSPNTGDLTYPGDVARHGNNAADLFEFRIAPEAHEVAYRFSLNTLLVRDSTLIALAFDSDGNAATGSPVLAKDPGAPFPGTDDVLYTWGTGAQWSHWTGTAWAATDLSGITTDLEANQITVVVPRTVADPTGVWKATLAVGLYNTATGGWLPPAGMSASDPNPVDILNLGFRFNEPVLTRNVPPDTAQAAALRAKAPTTFQRAIDFNALAAGEFRSNVPTTGTIVRYFPSRLDLGEGKDFSTFPGYKGRLQPYSVYVPTGYSPSVPAGLTLNLHSLSEHHWQYNGSKGVQQLGQGRGNIVATAMARGDDGWYQNEAEYDVFEMWNDIAYHYALDPNRTAITGYSMGGYATYRLGTLYPDLFGKAMTVVGPPADGIWVPPLPPTGGNETLSNLWLENARNLPYLNIVSAEDELVPITGTTQQSIGPAVNGMTSFDALSYRYRFDVYNPGDHLHLALLSYDLPQGPEFMGRADVDRNPDHVTFSYTPAADDSRLGLVHDHAYWVAGVTLADGKVGAPVPEATVDVRTHARGRGDPASARSQGAGTVPTPYTSVSRTWADPPAIPVENKLTATLTNVGRVTLDARRAGLDIDRDVVLDITATTDGVVLVAGEGADAAVSVRAGRATYVLAAGELRGAPAFDGGRVLAVTGTGDAGLAPAVAALAVAVALRRLRRRAGTI